MKTLSVTHAGANMTRWLDQAVAGESIGITHKGRIIKLQPESVTEDWAIELDRASENILRSDRELVGSERTVSREEFKKRRKP